MHAVSHSGALVRSELVGEGGVTEAQLGQARWIAGHLRKPRRPGEVPALEQQGLSELDLAALLVDVEDEFGQVRQLF